MGNAYTPGLAVTPDTIVRRVRRLPIKGEVVVAPGDGVEPDDVVARAMLPGALQTIKLAEKLGVEAKEVEGFFMLKPGDAVEAGQVVAETKGFLGIGRARVTAECTGTIESISEVTGNVLVREPAIPIEVRAYIKGKVAEVMPGDGVVIESRGAMVQGIFGIGGERTGTIRMACSGPDEVLEAECIKDDDAGKILVGGAGVSLAAIRRGSAVGAAGLVAGGIKDSDLIEFLGYDIGVAITGQEQIGLTILVTEGFGFLRMADRTFALLKDLEGKTASINGATQIRAGVIRPEIIVPSQEAKNSSPKVEAALELAVGTPIRVIREPYFGRLGAVTALPPQLMVVDSGTEVRVLRARLEGGEEVLVPRANVEIIAS